MLQFGIFLPSLLLCLLLSSAQLHAAESEAKCSGHFAQETLPIVISEKLLAQTRLLCFTGFAVLHSGISRTPLWSAEYLTAPRLGQARMLKRRNEFHAESRLSPAQRAELDDYKYSGLDRGHLAPAGNMTTDQEQYESFSLANIIPQNPRNNQILWEGIEYSTRELSFERSSLYVISGPMFEGKTLERINERVLIPTHVFKAIYDPNNGQAGAYVAANAAGLNYQVISIAALEKRIGITLFPKLDAEIKAVAMALPRPQPYKYRSRGRAMPNSGIQHE